MHLDIRSGPRHFFRLSLIEWLLKKNLKKGSILDAGSGDGSLSIRLAKRGFFVYALDYSEKWTSLLRRRIKNSLLEKTINVICLPLEKMNFEPELFDAIICGEVLEHLQNDLEILKKFYLFLKKKGILILTVPLKGKGRDCWDDMVGHLRLYEFGELKSNLESIGFFVDRVFSWGYPFGKFYHRFIFLKWAKKIKNEDEILKPKYFMTYIGKNPLVSFILGLFLFIDILFTPQGKGIGTIIIARKI